MSIYRQKPWTILHVEDDPVVLLAYRSRLQREGFRVESAEDGLVAVKILHKLMPDLIVLDLMLPRFDGVEVLRFIRADPRFKEIPTIILSTNSITEVTQEYVLETANKRLIKDVCTFSMLLEAIHELLPESAVAAEAFTADQAVQA